MANLGSTCLQGQKLQCAVPYECDNVTQTCVESTNLPYGAACLASIDNPHPCAFPWNCSGTCGGSSNGVSPNLPLGATCSAESDCAFPNICSGPSGNPPNKCVSLCTINSNVSKLLGVPTMILPSNPNYKNLCPSGYTCNNDVCSTIVTSNSNNNSNLLLILAVISVCIICSLSLIIAI